MIDRYTKPEMAEIWSDEARYRAWLDVELAACRAMEKRSLVPAGTAETIAPQVTIDAARIAEIEADVHHDVIAFLTHVEEQAGETARWLHLGMTSSDVLDTAFALQLSRAGQLLVAEMSKLRDAVKKRAHETKLLPMVGRSHGIHAEPTSVGVYLAGVYAQLSRDQARITHALSEVAVGKISGAVGVYGNLPPSVEADALDALGLAPEAAATQVVARDRHAALFAAMGIAAASIERLALQIRHWQRTEVGEAGEPFGSKQKGSSAMPHKRNPILSENVCGLARLVRSHVAAALENIALWHERDISHSSVERVIGPDTTTLLHFMITRMTRVIGGLTFDEERLAANLSLTRGLIFSEAVLLALVRKGMPRQSAYKLVQAEAMAAQAGKGDFQALLAADKKIASTLTKQELSACFDVAHHLKHVDYIFERVFKGTSS